MGKLRSALNAAVIAWFCAEFVIGGIGSIVSLFIDIPSHNLLPAITCWILGIPVAIFFARKSWNTAIRTERAKDGLCVYCGYDLRASPDRCPECGRITPKIEIKSN
jgi:hypothetical protein